MAAFAQFNRLYVVESLDSGDLHAGQRLVSEVKPMLASVSLLTAVTANDFVRALYSVWSDAATRQPRVYPMLHVDAHGTDDKTGIRTCSGEVVTWGRFAELCRQINVECQNNLVVTTGLCFGMLSITAIKMAEAAPFCALVGPQEKISAHEADCFSSFYMELLRSSDVDAAIRALHAMAGSDKCKLFLSERLFLNSFAAYIRASCKGKGRLERVERLLTEYNASRRAGRRLSLQEARKIIKAHTQPDAAAFERFKRRFLLSDHPLNVGRFPSDFAQAMKVAGP